MKNSIRLLALALALIGLTACATNNYKKGVDTSAGLQQSAAKIELAKGKMNEALNALNDLVNNPTNLVAQYATFSAGVGYLQSHAHDLNAAVQSVQSTGEAYFKAWDHELTLVQNPDIKKRSADRKMELQQQFGKIKERYQETAAACRPFMSDLRDIQGVLGTDLTLGGINVIKPAAEKANHDAEVLGADVNKLASQLRELAAALSSVTPPPAKTK